MSDHSGSRREYAIIFVVLAVLTVLEVLVAKAPVDKGPMVAGLIGLAVTKAVLVALFYMHLKTETRVLKLTVLVPMMTPVVYALVLIGEGMWRMKP